MTEPGDVEDVVARFVPAPPIDIWNVRIFLDLPGLRIERVEIDDLVVLLVTRPVQVLVV